MELIENYNAIYPNYKGHKVAGTCEIVEYANLGKPGIFQKLKLSNFKGWQINREITSATTSVYEKSEKGCPDLPTQCHYLLHRDCDGLLYESRGEEIRLYAFELKSSYSTDNIVKAKDQLVGSLLKMQAQLSILQGYCPAHIKYIGVIVAFEPTAEQKCYILKNFSNRDALFCGRLLSEKQYDMSSERCSTYWSPLRIPEITLRLVTVPGRNIEHPLDFNALGV